MQSFGGWCLTTAHASQGGHRPEVLLGAALLAALAWNLVQASEIKGLQLDSGATGTRAEIALDQATATSRSSASATPTAWSWTCRLRSLSPGPAACRPPTGVVSAVRTGAPAPGTARIVFDLAQPVAVLKPRIEQGVGGPSWCWNGRATASRLIRGLAVSHATGMRRATAAAPTASLAPQQPASIRGGVGAKPRRG